MVTFARCDWPDQAYTVARQRTERDGRKPKPRVRRFAGIDGEGWGADRYGRQEYRLLLVASADWSRHLATEKHMRWSEALHFVANLPLEYTYVGYGLGYDFCQMLRTLPEECLQSLMRPESRTGTTKTGARIVRPCYTPKVEIAGRYWYFGLQLIPRKQLKVRAWSSPDLNHWDHRDGTWAAHKTVTLWDVFSFFQSSFLKAATDSLIVPSDKLDTIRAGKLRRGDNPDHDLSQEIEYCRTECEALAAMVKNVDNLCASAGYPLRDYYGAGSIATAMMRVENTKDHTHPVNIPDGMLPACAHAFFGGRFENRMFGHVGTIYEYDLNSAYVGVQYQVPCMVHGHWQHIVGRPDTVPKPEQVGLYRVKWNWFLPPVKRGGTPIRPLWGPFLQRSSANGVHSPPSGQGWMCANEYDAARRWADQKGYTLTVTETWTWHPDCPVRPFAYMADGYRLRRELKQSGDGRQLVYKLGLNSHSGKCDQTVGGAPYHHPFLAAWIKAGCRAHILDAISCDPDAIVGVATDAVYSTRRLPLKLGSELNEWTETLKPDAFLYQPGIGWGENDDDQWVKRRGIATLTPELRRQVVTQFATAGELTTLVIKKPIFYGLARNRPRYMLGRWSTLNTSVTIGPGDKRYILSDRDHTPEEWDAIWRMFDMPAPERDITPYVAQPVYDSLPRDGLHNREGYPYGRFVARHHLSILAPRAPESEAAARQELDDETDALLERPWIDVDF